jgi:periplasmic protein TonB
MQVDGQTLGVPADSILGGLERGRQRDPAFTLSLCCALMMHGAFLINIGSAQPRSVGSPEGSDSAIAVSMITEAEFDSRVSSASMPAPPPAAPAAAPPPQQTQVQPQPQPEFEAVPEPVVEPQPPEPVPPEPLPPDAIQEPTPRLDTANIDAAKAEQSKTPDAPKTEVEATVPDLEKAVPDLLALPDPSQAAPKTKSDPQPEPKPAAKPKPPAEKRQQTAKLDLSTPAARFDALPGAGSGAAAFQRPPGITRSGLNDAFARAVIQALQQTMPQLSNTRGRVTVRIFLTENGNISDVRVINPSNVAGLDQSVVFATRQTNYPIPPGGSNEADRTFLVTYIYR